MVLLGDLANAGLPVDQYADFLFFRFRNGDKDIDIDIIAAKHARIPANSDVRVYLRAIQRMAILAETHSNRGSSVQDYLRSLDWDWTAQLVFRNPSKVYEIIKAFATLASVQL